jgi:hypothetical protein
MGLGNECDDAHLVSAPGTLERVDLEDAPQRVCRPPFACTTPARQQGSRRRRFSLEPTAPHPWAPDHRFGAPWGAGGVAALGGGDVVTAKQWRERVLGVTLEAPGGGPTSS